MVSTSFVGGDQKDWYSSCDLGAEPRMEFITGNADAVTRLLKDSR
jgi:hypothetical protein